MEEKEQRIQKIIAGRGLCSRRAAEKLIAEGRILKNGRPVMPGDKADPGKDLITLDGKEIANRRDRFYYIMLYKPRGFVTTASDERGRRCVTQLTEDLGVRLYPVGRLDMDSEGLLLMTNDGDFAQSVAHPSNEVPKIYRVSVRGALTPKARLALIDGIDCGGEVLRADDFQIVSESAERTVLEIRLTEGKNRHIRRIFEACGTEVLRLKRTAEGNLRLGGLKPGKYRELTPQELAGFKKHGAGAAAQRKR